MHVRRSETHYERGYGMAGFDGENMKVGTVVMTRRYVSDRPTQHCISLEDQNSGMMVAEIQMSPEEFGAAIQCTTAKCKFIINQSPVVGNKSEHKIVEIKRPKELSSRGEDREKLLRSLVAAHETNGWIGSYQDLDNMHNVVESRQEYGHWYFRVGFHRYVDEKGNFIPLVDESKLLEAARIAMKAIMLAGDGDDNSAYWDVIQYLLENKDIVSAAFPEDST